MEPPVSQPPLFSSTPTNANWRNDVPTVSQLTRRVRGHLESAFTEVWVKGEISNFKKPVSGHAYLLLKDATAQIRTVLFRPTMTKLRFALSDGMEVLVHGRLSVYEARGEYQLVGDHVEPLGQGALQLAFEQLKAKLLAEGLFDEKHKKDIPALARHIGIITSATGAAVKDVLKVLNRRFPNLDVLIFPASVQGEKAAPEICTALRQAELWNTQNPNRAIEVLIVGRGGGSIEDLWCFNEETVARAIFACPIPIISAVGHEIDVTIADFVADLRAPTPSAAAEMVIPDKSDLIALINSLNERLAHALRRSIDQVRLHVTHLSGRLIDPRERIQRVRQQLRVCRQRLTLAMTNYLARARQRAERSLHLLNALSPLAVLGRGFSLTQKSGGVFVRHNNEVKKGECIVTRLATGWIESSVISTSSEEPVK